MSPLPKGLRRFEKERVHARRFLRNADALARATAALTAGPPPKRKPPGVVAQHLARSVRKLDDVVVEAKKHLAVAIVDEKRLTAQHLQAGAGDASPSEGSPERLAAYLGEQRLHVDALRQAVSRLMQSRTEAAWQNARLQAENAVEKAAEALARTRGAAERAGAQLETWKPPIGPHPAGRRLSTAALTRKLDRMVAALAVELTQAKKRVAVTIADEKRFAYWYAEAQAPVPNSMYVPSTNPEIMARALAAQKTAAAEALDRLRHVASLIDATRRDCRAIVLRRIHEEMKSALLAAAPRRIEAALRAITSGRPRLDELARELAGERALVREWRDKVQLARSNDATELADEAQLRLRHHERNAEVIQAPLLELTSTRKELRAMVGELRRRIDRSAPASEGPHLTRTKDLHQHLAHLLGKLDDALSSS